jgi:hypothetical protein
VKNLVNPQYKCGKVENVQVARFVKLDVDTSQSVKEVIDLPAPCTPFRLQ